MPLQWWPPSLSSSSSPQVERQRYRRLTRAKKLRHLGDHDVKDLDFFLNSPDRDNAKDFRRASSHRPQPLPLPDLSTAFAASDRFVKEESRLAGYHFRLPSPTGSSAVGPSRSNNSEKDRERDRVRAKEKEKEKHRLLPDLPSFGDGRVSPREGRCSVDSLRNVDAQRKVETRRNVDGQRVPTSQPSIDYTETWSPVNVTQNIRVVDRAQEKYGTDVPLKSVPTSVNSSPMPSPRIMLNQDMFAMPPGDPKTRCEPVTMSGVPNLAVAESTLASRENSLFQSQPMKTRVQARKSTVGSTSPRRPKLSVEVSSPHHDSVVTNVYPLPLPPTPASSALSSPSPACQVAPRSELLQAKGQWTKGKLIGRGTFGSVYIATNRETGALCALKEVDLFPDDPKSAECIRQLEQEIKVLSQLQHPNIVQYYGSEIVDDRFFIYLEYVYPGSINKYVREHCGAMTEAVVRNFTRHIISGLAYLHAKKTIHRDIKGANLLVDSLGIVKLADFGMAKHLTGPAAELSLKGSPYWMAPELMQDVMQKDNNSVLAYAVDIWSLGCTMIEMLTGKPPWSEYEGPAAMFRVLKESPTVPETLSPEGKDFLQCCFRRNPAERPTASKLLEHPFLRNSQWPDVSSSNPELHVNLLNLNEKPASTPGAKFDLKLDVLPSPSRRVPNGKGLNK